MEFLNLINKIKMYDIGAMEEDNNNRFNQKYELYLFEPQEKEYLKLKEKNKNVYNSFLGDGKEHTFYITRFPGCCSILEPNLELTNQMSTFMAYGLHTNPFLVLKKEKIVTTKLDDIEIPLPRFIKLDTQGSELLILQNGISKLKECTVIECESEFIQLYKNQPLYGEVDKFLREQGFIFHKFIDFRVPQVCPYVKKNYQGLLSEEGNQIISADGIWLKNIYDLEKYSNDELIETSYILFNLYKSYDVVCRLLYEYCNRIKNNKYIIQYLDYLNKNNLEKYILNIKSQV